MRSRLGLLVSVLFIISLFLVTAMPAAEACGHQGIYMGGGYTQRHLFTTERQLTLSPNPDKISFGPGYGAHLLVGYDFCAIPFGIQFPVEYTTLILNHSERVSHFSVSAEGVYHIASWKNGWDVHLVGGGGWSYLTEGVVKDRSESHGMNIGVGPGVSWYFVREKHFKSAITLAMPFRATIFFGNRLSSGQTTVFEVPLRLSLTFGGF